MSAAAGFGGVPSSVSAARRQTIIWADQQVAPTVNGLSNAKITVILRGTTEMFVWMTSNLLPLQRGSAPHQSTYPPHQQQIRCNSDEVHVVVSTGARPYILFCEGLPA